ncbi:glycosyltransferase family A protein [Janthinobacterium sp. YR213]|uniref:glycosyltransferase family 2 protein n=1 Tax=Janthinobacterium sp. YR213 TaxID=1881027 RepID=UPI0008868053|nr:glycosyltransferase family A protein [Janthinobacterium sp. YR213]SDH21939.1 Glycosyl transferase family 2 [Janthinobacterium sp. YR213]
MPLLSAIIPTHNRQRYAINAITTILTNFPDTEVVVSDTSDTMQIAEELGHWIESGRLIYHHPQRPMDVVSNFQNGLRLATGDYLIFLGDDDCLGPGAEELARWARDTQVEAAACSLGAAYFWPDFKSLYFGADFTAKLTVQPFASTISPLDGPQVLQQALKNLGTGVMSMPRAYLGMMSRALAERIEQKYGSLFGGVSPDIYSAALIAEESRSSVQIDFPFIIAGSSGGSTSGQSAEGGHKGGLRDNAHIGAFTNLVWDPLIPEFYSVPTVWSYSFKAAIDKIGKAGYRPNLPRLYAKCCLHHPKYWRETKASLCAYVKRERYSPACLSFVWELCREFSRRAYRFMQIKFKPAINRQAYAHQNLTNIGEAYAHLLAHVQPSLSQLQSAMKEFKR